MLISLQLQSCVWVDTYSENVDVNYYLLEIGHECITCLISSFRQKTDKFTFRSEILLSFFAETEQGVAQAIIRSVLDFKRDPWPKVSDNAKDLVRKMLDPDPSRRLTAQQVLGKVSI